MGVIRGRRQQTQWHAEQAAMQVIVPLGEASRQAKRPMRAFGARGSRYESFLTRFIILTDLPNLDALDTSCVRGVRGVRFWGDGEE